MKTISDYTLLCTPEQTKKALELGAPLNMWRFLREPVIPTAEQMMGWLREQGVKFLLSDEPDEDGDYWFVGINEEEQTSGADKENKELAAIDAALEYLTNKK